jgi:hypothetical protein
MLWQLNDKNPLQNCQPLYLRFLILDRQESLELETVYKLDIKKSLTRPLQFLRQF